MGTLLPRGCNASVRQRHESGDPIPSCQNPSFDLFPVPFLTVLTVIWLKCSGYQKHSDSHPSNSPNLLCGPSMATVSLSLIRHCITFAFPAVIYSTGIMEFMPEILRSAFTRLIATLTFEK